MQVQGAPKLSIALTATNTVIISWASPSTGFRFGANSDVEQRNWTNVGSSPGDDGTTKSVICPSVRGSKFYRLKK